MECENALQVVPETNQNIATWTATDVMAQVDQIQELMRKGMKDGEHFGIIPGCEKPTLYKPGAEKLSLMFRLAPKFDVQVVDMPNGHRECRVTCSLYHIGTNAFWGCGVGSCSTMETKYRYRGHEALSTGNQVPKEYWELKKASRFKEMKELIGGDKYMPSKIDGVWFICEKGAKTENPDIADTYNTVLKMAKKRAHVDAVLSATAASDIFTQDMEEITPVAVPPKKTAPAPSSKSPMRTTIIPKAVLSHVSGDTGKPYWTIQDLEDDEYYTTDKQFADIAAQTIDIKGKLDVSFELRRKSGIDIPYIVSVAIN